MVSTQEHGKTRIIKPMGVNSRRFNGPGSCPYLADTLSMWILHRNSAALMWWRSSVSLEHCLKGMY